MNKPSICGNDRINLPDSGCGDCDALAYEIEKIKKWIETFEEEGYNSLSNKPTINGVTVEGDKTSADYLIAPLSDDDIVDATPIECYQPPCQDSRACYGEACCMLVGCNTNTTPIVCEGGVCYATIECPPASKLSVSVEALPNGDQVGDTISVTYTVKNEGNTNLTNISVSAPRGATPTWTIAELNAGESSVITEEYTITESDISLGTLVFSITATDGTLSDYAETLVRLVPEPGISVEISYEAPSGTDLGNVINLTYTLTNTGDADLTDVTLTDGDMDDEWTIELFGAGEVVTRNAIYTVVEEDITTGYRVFTAEATGTYEEVEVSDSDEVMVMIGEPNPRLTLTLDESEVDTDEGYISATYTVTNAGNVSFVTTTLLCEQTEDEYEDDDLAPGASMSYTLTYTFAEGETSKTLEVVARGTTDGGVTITTSRQDTFSAE